LKHFSAVIISVHSCPVNILSDSTLHSEDRGESIDLGFSHGTSFRNFRRKTNEDRRGPTLLIYPKLEPGIMADRSNFWKMVGRTKPGKLRVFADSELRDCEDYFLEIQSNPTLPPNEIITASERLALIRSEIDLRHSDAKHRQTQRLARWAIAFGMVSMAAAISSGVAQFFTHKPIHETLLATGEPIVAAPSATELVTPTTPTQELTATPPAATLELSAVSPTAMLEVGTTPSILTPELAPAPELAPVPTPRGTPPDIKPVYVKQTTPPPKKSQAQKFTPIKAPEAADRPGTLSISTAKTLATYAPRPKYPYEARSRHITGRGVCVVEVDPGSGSVTSASMASGSGNPALDKAALSAFRQWRFRPGSVSKVRIPITFTTTGAQY
jgi:periplasmic protein TonB